MAISRCNRCANLQELPDSQIGKSSPCSKCGADIPAYNTRLFVAKLLSKYFESQQELNQLKASKGKTLPSPSAELSPTDEIDLSNTDYFTSEAQHGPIQDWFARKHINIEANLRGVDTTGFFDEVALSIGSNLPLLGGVLERIRWAQHKEFASTTIHFEKKSENDASEISSFCQYLYDFSFVAKCIHNRHERNIRLVLQTAPAIRRFFDGEWLEWYALMVFAVRQRTKNTLFMRAQPKNHLAEQGKL